MCSVFHLSITACLVVVIHRIEQFDSKLELHRKVLCSILFLVMVRIILENGFVQ